MPGTAYSTVQALAHPLFINTLWVVGAVYPWMLIHLKNKEIQAENSVLSHTAGKNEGKSKQSTSSAYTVAGPGSPSGQTAVSKQTLHVFRKLPCLWTLIICKLISVLELQE